jgi:hypothetical protein
VGKLEPKREDMAFVDNRNYLEKNVTYKFQKVGIYEIGMVTPAHHTRDREAKNDSAELLRIDLVNKSTGNICGY